MPTEPTVDLKGEGPVKTTMVWSDLAELFPESPGMVRPLAVLEPGAAVEEARPLIEAAQMSSAKVHESELAGHRTLSSVLQHGSTEVPITLVFDAAGQHLVSVDLDIEWPAASAVLGERWGAPAGPPVSGGRAMARWPAGSWVVELHRLPEGKGILHFGAPPE